MNIYLRRHDTLPLPDFWLVSLNVTIPFKTAVNNAIRQVSSGIQILNEILFYYSIRVSVLLILLYSAMLGGAKVKEVT